MQGLLAHLAVQNGLHTLANGAAAFIGSAFAIIVVGLIIRQTASFLGKIFGGLQSGYRIFIKKAAYVTGTRYDAPLRWSIFLFWSILCVALVAFATPGMVLVMWN